MANCLVIGGGFLGGAIARTLSGHRHEVVVFSRSLGSRFEEGTARRIRTVAGTIAPGRELAELIDQCDVVLYFAGGSTPAGAVADAGGSVQLSVVPATTVLELMRESSTRRIVLASSGGTVYGEPLWHPTPEDHPTDPIGIHGHNALTVERYAHFFEQRHGLEPVILRIATAYGPGQRQRRGQGVIAAWTEAALRRVPADVYGSVLTRRDFVFVDDVARAAVHAAFEAAAGIYNVGSGGSHTLAEVLDLLGHLAGGDIQVTQHNAREVDVQHTELDCSRLATEVGWVPTTQLDAGLRQTWEWTVAQPRISQLRTTDER